MRQYLLELLTESGSLNTEDILIRIISAAVISLAVYISYWYTHTGTTYSRKFNVSLVVLAVITATAMTVIANNLALSLGMVGALSIVRYRTAIKDSRDTTYIFWSIVIGICCGAGDYLVAGVGSAIIFLVLLVLGRVRNENRILLILRGPKGADLEAEGIIRDYFKGKAQMKVKNTSLDAMEMIFEMPRNVYMKMYQQEKTITDRLYEIPNMDYVNVVTQSDEITG